MRMRVDIPETIIDHANNSIKVYVLGVEKYRYDHIEISLNREIIHGEGVLMLSGETPEERVDVVVTAETGERAYHDRFSVTLTDGGLLLKDSKNEKTVPFSSLPLERVMEGDT